MAKKTLRQGSIIFVNGQVWDAESHRHLSLSELKQLAKEQKND